MLYTWKDFALQAEMRKNKPLTNHALNKKKRYEAAKEAKRKVKEALEKAHKICTSCNEEKSFSSFDVNKKSATGYASMCKACKKEYNKKYLRGSTTLKGYKDDEANRE